MRSLRTLGLAITLATTSLAACDSKKDEAPAGATVAAEPTPAADEAPAPAEPAEPAAPAYSPDAAQKLVVALEACDSEHGCEAYTQLVAFGPQAVPQLTPLALDEAKPVKTRALAVKALGAARAEVDLLALHASIAKADDYGLSSAFESAAPTLVDAEGKLAAKLRADYLAGQGDEMATRRLLRKLPGTADWALTTLEGEHDAERDVELADLVSDAADKEHLPRIQALLDGEKVSHRMARHRLAAKAIELGDTTRFAVLIAGLEAEDKYDRADAANFFANVAKQTPEELKPKAIELLKAGQASGGGGLETRGFGQSLKALGAE